ncbi:MAG: glycosyltransferase [Bacteroidota bacterium]
MNSHPESAAPRVSVVMSVYNGERYLRQAVDSILAQSFRDFELLCIDDGSADATPEILAAYAARDARVRVLSQENRGLIASLNRGVSEARGGLIARMDDDDVSHPERFERMVAVFEREPETVLVSCNLQIMDTEGQSGSVYDSARDADLAGWFLLFYNYVGGHSQVMYRRAAALDAGAYAADDRHAEDYGLWCRLTQRGAVRLLPEALQRYRYHAGSVSRQHRGEQMHYTAVVARHHMERTLGATPTLDEVKMLQRFWLAYAAQGYRFPEASDLGTVDANLRSMVDAYRSIQDGRALTPAMEHRLKQRIADRYTKWALKLPPRSPAALAVSARALRWDPGRTPTLLKKLTRRALKR